MTAGAIHQKITDRYINNHPALLMIDTYALSVIAANIASCWGVQVTDGSFYKRDIQDVVAEFDELNSHDKAMLEWAILDNINAFCAWMEPERRSIRTATLWPEYRPAYLSPMKYKLR